MEIGESDGSLEALAARLNRPADSLRHYAALSVGERAALVTCIDRALAHRRKGIDQSLARLLPWPLRAPLLRMLRR